MAEGLRREPLRVTLGEPSVSDICDIGRVIELLWLDDFGEVCEFPRARDLATGERWLRAKDSK